MTRGNLFNTSPSSDELASDVLTEETKGKSHARRIYEALRKYCSGVGRGKQE